MTSKPSPFLPGTKLQYVWDSTSLGWLKTCPRLYQYSMLEGWRRKGTTSVHLVFGQHYHAALELYDKLKAQRGADFDHEDALREVLLDLLYKTWEYDTDPETGLPVSGGPWVADHPSKNRDSLIRSVVWYLEEHHDDPIETLVLKNGKPAVELTFKFDSQIPIKVEGPEGHSLWVAAYSEGNDQQILTDGTYILSGHLDRIGLFQGEPYVLDRKTTTGSLDYRFFAQFNPHNQMSLYTIAGEVAFGTPLRGVIIEGAQIGAGFTRFARAFTLRTEALSEEYLADLEPWLRSAEHYAATDRWPKNELSCSNYGGCTFREVCGADPGVRQRFLETQFERSEWNPLIER